MSPPVLGLRSPSLSAQPAGVVAVGDEADVVRVGLVGHEQPAPGGLLAHRGLARVAQREQRVRELVLVEHAEHVGLVLAVVDRAVHLDEAVVAGAQLGVVAGGDGVEAEGQRPVEHGGELDLLVAAQARVGRAAGGVLVHEVLDHVLVEAVGEVPDVERDADDVGRAAGVVAVLDRAAAAGAGAVGRGVAREREVDAGDVVAGLDGAGRGDGRVDPAGHGGDDPHRVLTRGPGRAGALDDRTDRLDEGVDVGGGGGVPEREAQRVAGLVGVAAHGQQHVGRLRDAGAAGRAGGALDAAGVEQHQQRVALAAREADVGVAGQPPAALCVAAEAPCRWASGTTSTTRRTRSSRSAATRSACSGWRLDRRLDGGGEAGDGRRVEGAAADVALLPAAVHERRRPAGRGVRRARRRRRGRRPCAR